jgi:N-acetylglucosamine kinase
MTERLVIGMDVGGTKTRAMLVDERGRILGQGVAGTGNYNFVPIEEAARSFQQAITDARKMAGPASLQVEHIVIGIEPQPDPLYPHIKKVVKYQGIERRPEGECSMVGGLVEKVGLSLIAGTGSVGFGRNRQGKTHVTSCWGTIGDEGSAWWLANQGVNAAFWAEDGRGPRTVLLGRLLRHFGVKTLRDACTPIYTDPNVRRTFSQFSRMVMDAARRGDRVSKGIVEQGAEQIVHLLVTCAKVLGMQRSAYRVAATGGLVERGGWYFDLVRRGLRRQHAKADLVLPRFEPGIGAALIALDVIGVKWTEAVVANLQRTLGRTRAKE